MGSHRTLFVGIALVVLLGVGSGAGVWYYRHTLPGRRAQRRARQLSLLFPPAITYVDALSRGADGVRVILLDSDGTERDRRTILFQN